MCFSIIYVISYDDRVTGMVASWRGKLIINFALLVKTATYLHGHCDSLADLKPQVGNPSHVVTDFQRNAYVSHIAHDVCMLSSSLTV
jgi:hypothetical protein